MKRDLIILFAKAPIPGQVKTRLVPPLSPEHAAALHQRLVDGVWKMLATLDADRELHTDVPCQAWPEAQPRRLQSQGDLGARMLHALEEGLRRGYRKVTIVGGDLAALPPAHLLRLIECPADIALGPTEDGGYYALACRAIHAAMFDRVRWSTPHALDDTLAAAKRCGLTASLGEPWFDIDTPDDLRRLHSFGFGGGNSFASHTD